MKGAIRRMLSRSSVALVAAVTLAACGTASGEVDPTVTRVAVEGAPPTRPPTLPADATPAPGGTAATPAGGDGGGGELATSVELNMVDLAFEPTDFAIAANTDVAVNLTNSGNLPHAFQLEDGSVESDELASGETGSVTLNLPPGEYPYICPVPGHADSGMAGSITVQ